VWAILARQQAMANAAVDLVAVTKREMMAARGRG
jgi:hypothetical protein